MTITQARTITQPTLTGATPLLGIMGVVLITAAVIFPVVIIIKLEIGF